MIIGSVAGGSSAATDPWKALYRPLEVPRIAPGGACPVSTVDRSIDFAGFGIAPGIGSGPAYPVGPYRVRFERGNVPPREWCISASDTVYWSGQPDGSRGKPSYTRLGAAGCYGYQIDGRTFSRVIVFRARWPSR